jgi:tRNA nucleotidyltransferase (CCA-adding enzyme)
MVGACYVPGMSEDEAALARDLERVHALAEAVRDAGGRTLIVGGCARVEALRRMGSNGHTKDVDVEVYGLTFDELRPLLARVGDIDVVGAAFQVAKLKHTSIDVSIPRRDSKVAPGHRGFDVQGDPTMSIREAMRRRDFTVNALGLDPLTGELVDEYGGVDDLRAGILRATDPELFGDDPLRALRAMQLSARLSMRVDPATAELCRGLDLGELPAERIGEEWSKLLLRAERPSVGLQVGRDIGVIDSLHPELARLVGTRQDPQWHPEGDVWEHTLLVVDEAAFRVREHGGLQPEDALAVMFGALCHDLGKPATTALRGDGHVISHGHSEAGLEPTGSFLATLRAPGDLTARVLKLVLYHLWPGLTPEFTDRAVRRLARNLVPASIELLVMVATADHDGRGAIRDGFPRGRELLGRAAELEVRSEAERPIVMGRHLVELGLKPGPEYAKILDFLYDAQEAGEFSDVAGGLVYLRASGRLDSSRSKEAQ